MDRRSFLSFTAAANAAGLPSLLGGAGREKMTIRDARVTWLTYTPPEGHYVHEAGPIVIYSYDCGILELFTDQGLVGIGPAEGRGPSGRGPDVSKVIGKNPFDVETLGLSDGLDVACWDIIGKAKGQPVYKLLAGGKGNPKVHVYASAGVNWTFYDRGDGKPYGASALIEEALRFKEMGFDTFKWRPGTDWEAAGMTARKLGETVCRKLRDAVGPSFRLGLEKKAYDAWTFDEALEIAPIINDLKFFFFEQPMMDLGPSQFDDYRKIKAQMPNVMLWGGESFRNLAQAQPFIDERIYDAIQSDTIRLGFTENSRVARAAAAKKLKVVPHNWSTELGTISNAHLVAGSAAGFMCEYLMYPNTVWRDVLFKEPLKPVNGYLTLSDKPGLGVELADLESLKRKFPYNPSARRLEANPRFPDAMKRARAREQQVIRRYSGGKG